MKIKHCVLSGGVAVAVCLFCSIRPVHAQTGTSAAAKSEHTNTISPFVLLLRERAQKSHALYLVEGEPAPEETTVSPGASPNDQNSGESLDQIAARFDYRAERLPSGIVVFHKTYYDERDLPSVTLAECLASLKDIERVTEAVNPHVPPPTSGRFPLADGIVSVFGPDQFAAMQRGQAEVESHITRKAAPPDESTTERGGLPVSSLNGEQKAEVWRIARYLYIQEPLKAVSLTLQKAKSLAGETPVFVFHDVAGLHLFGYELKDRFIPLSNPYQLPAEFDDAYPPWMIGKGDSVPPKFDPTQPKEKPEKTISATPQAINLQTLVQRLKARENTSVTVDKPVMVDEELCSKRLCIVGELDSAIPLSVIRAAAALYGLRVVNSADSTVLTRVRTPFSNEVAQTATIISELLPLPLETACQQVARTGDPAQVKIKFSSGATIQSNPSATALKWAAVRRLRETVEDKINRSADKRVSLADLDDKEKEAFAVIVVSPCVRTLVNFVQKPTPSFITDFNQTVLIGGVTMERGGKKWLNVNMGRRMPDGKLAQGGSGFASPLSRP